LTSVTVQVDIAPGKPFLTTSAIEEAGIFFTA